MTYGMDYRIAVFNAHDTFKSSIEVAELFGCCQSWVRRLVQRHRETGSLEPIVPKHPDRRKLKDDDLERLRGLIEKQPDLTLEELAAALDHKASVTTVWRATRKMDLTYKCKTQHASEQDRPDVKKKRDEWFGYFAKVKANRLVFIDEFAAATNMTRRRGRAPLGERLVSKTPHGHWKTLSTIAALTIEGIITSTTFEGSTNAEIFTGFVEQFLLPNLKPDQIVVLDNLKTHTSQRVAELVKSVGAQVMLLPPYSPDFNPIEMAISKVKSYLKKYGARTVEALFNTIGPALSSVTRDDAVHYMIHSGYVATVT